MMLEEQVSTRECVAEPAVELSRRMKLLAQPDRQTHQEQLEAAWRVREVRLEDSIELQEWFVVERHEIEVLRSDPPLGEAVLDSVPGEVGVVLLPGESLFLSRRHDATVLHEARSAVVIKGRDSEDVHRLTFPRRERPSFRP
jgi:hypothetical protein